MYEHLTIEAATKHILEEGFASWKRWLFQFMDDFRRNPRIEMVVHGPASETSEKLKCLFASTVFYLCKEKSLDVPKWVFDVEPLKEPWFVSGLESMKTFAIVESPAFFKQMNVFVLDNFMIRV
jgi:hypothetical protein